MKLYKNAIAEMPISSCKECPNKASMRYKNGTKFHTGYVCKAIEVVQEDINTGEQKLMNPSIVDAVWHGFFPTNCPLADIVETASCRLSENQQQDAVTTLQQDAVTTLQPPKQEQK